MTADWHGKGPHGLVWYGWHGRGPLRLVRLNVAVGFRVRALREGFTAGCITIMASVLSLTTTENMI